MVPNHPKFQEWKSNDHENLLWLSADPGCGKSVLSKILIDDVLTRDTSATICYFFVKDNQEQHSGATAICALLHQVFSAKTDLFKNHAQRAIEQEREGLKSNFESLWKVLLSVVLDSSRGT
jgi:type II secretory pathway predicted ATPase ExeA